MTWKAWKTQKDIGKKGGTCTYQGKNPKRLSHLQTRPEDLRMMFLESEGPQQNYGKKQMRAGSGGENRAVSRVGGHARCGPSRGTSAE